MDLISTHIGADFDAFASMLAARRLHPGGQLFFPGSREESVRRMIDSGFVRIEELRQREIDPRAIERLILCDIRQRDRIGVLADWLELRPAIELIVYDHHPDAIDDLVASGGSIDPGVGATSTLMVEEFRRRGLAVDPREASILLMGIYEDTGSLTYPTVSARDLEAAAWLLGRGGDLEPVRRFAVHRLDAEHLNILHRMTRALEVHRRCGHRVGVVALELGSFVDELAPLVSRCLDIFELPLLFGVFGEKERVTLIARGDLEGLDLGEFLAHLGAGGGHATAASGSFRGLTAIEVREKLLAGLDRWLPPAARARDLMVEDFFVLPQASTVDEVKRQINRWRVNAAPVVDDSGLVVGAITRQLLDAAIQHGLGERPVETVMSRELEWVDPEAPAEILGERILSRHPRFVLVGERNERKPLGLVTRMQVLRHLYGRLDEAGRPLDRRSREQRRQQQSIQRLLEQRLPASLLTRIREVSEVARLHRIRVHLVGGFVRDLLLGRENRDLDLVVEGDGPHFADLLAQRLGGRVRIHHAFMTAVVIGADGFRIDVATARSEFYRAPGALPEVQTSALRQDLYRRDFTINTLAIRLGPDQAPALIDYFGGRRDLRERKIRVLHSLSFIDDPTRVLRAVRLEQRLGFGITAETLRLIEVALGEGVFEQLSGTRLREELVLLLEEPMTAERCVERLSALGLLSVLHPALRFDLGAQVRVRALVAAFDWYHLEGLREPPVSFWRLFLMGLAAEMSQRDLHALVQRLSLVGEDRRLFTAFQLRLREARRSIHLPDAAPHDIAAALAPLTGEELVMMMAIEDDAGRLWAKRALTDLRRLSLGIRGSDLLRHGFEPGPEIGRALQKTREARIDGRIAAEQELEYALTVLRRSFAARVGEGGDG